MAKLKTTPVQTSESKKVGRDTVAIWIAVGSCVLTGLSYCTQREALQDSREAAIKIESSWPGDRLSKPQVSMRIINLRDRTITNAKVGTKLAMLAPEDAGTIYNKMGSTTETIQPEDTESQTVYGSGTPYTQDQMLAFMRGDLVLIAALRVTWTAPGAWFSTTHDRCFAFTPRGSFACEDLINAPTQADAYVRDYFAHHPQIKQDWISPINADGSAWQLPD